MTVVKDGDFETILSGFIQNTIKIKVVCPAGFLKPLL